MLIARLIIDALLVLLLLGTGGGKLAQAKSSLAIRDSLDVSSTFWRITGGLEVLAVAGLIVGIWVPAAGLAASAGIVLLMVGAIVARARAGQRQTGGYVADTVVLLIAVASVILQALAI